MGKNTSTPPLLRLPIDSIEEQVCALPPSGRLVLSSPTGSGKSTQVPRWFRRKGRVLVVEPRRVACRSLAARVAELELKDKHKVPVAFPRAQEGVAPDVLAEAHDGTIVHLVLSRPAGLAPAVESLSVEEGRIAGLLKSLRNGCWRHGFPMTGRSQEGEKDSGKVQGLHA